MPRRLFPTLALFALAATAAARSPAPCSAGIDYEKEGYRVARVSVEDPFDFLRWLAARSRSVQAQLSATLAGKPFTYRSAGSEAIAAIERAQFVPSIPGTFVIRLEKASLENCRAASKTLDLVYRVYSTAPPKFAGGAAESQVVVERAPQTAAGLSAGGNPLRLAPSGGYDRAYGGFGGGRVDLRGFTVEGEGSRAMRSFTTTFAGSRAFQGWLRRAAWRIAYVNRSAPAGSTRLQDAALSAQLSAATRPFWDGAVFARFGALLEGGNMQSLVAGALLAPHTTANAAYGSLKLVSGVTSRTRHNVLSASYGLELGSVGPAARIDWRKHIVDVADAFWYPFADHKPFQVETRVTAGLIQIPGEIPLPARFFGGNAAGSFIPGDFGWQIRDTPVIRAIPADRLYLTPEGAGADRFAAVNLTVAYPVHARPIMPPEIADDPEVNGALLAQLRTAASLEQNYYAWKDPHFALARARLPDLRRRLDSLAAGASGDCLTNIQIAQFDIENTLKARGSAQYGNLAALLPPSDDLGAVPTACGAPEIASIRAALIADFGAIDQARARLRAERDIGFARRTLDTIFHEMNLYSVAPVAVFDAASIGTGLRLGPGAGLRLTVASTVNFTAGYAWNIRQQPGEGPGAVFFSITVRDIFH